MRLGLIGLGRIGAFHAQTLTDLPEPAQDPAALLAAGVDGVVVAAATDAHPSLILAAVSAGLPVFCEKPVARTMAEGLEVGRRVEAAGVPVQIGYQRRFDAAYQAARAAVASGELGWLHTVRATTLAPAPPPAAYVAVSGGIFRDCSVHDFDSIRWVTFEDPHVAEYSDPLTAERAAPGKQLAQMLFDGELDAAVVGGPDLKEPRFKPVIANPHEAAEAWCEKRGIRPINHMAVVTERLAQSNPGAVKEIFRLLRDSKERAGSSGELRTGVGLLVVYGLGLGVPFFLAALGFNAFLTGGANVVRADPSRIAAQIVTGIGFLGAGAILRQVLDALARTMAHGTSFGTAQAPHAPACSPPTASSRATP